jgi:hypothetical protein
MTPDFTLGSYPLGSVPVGGLPSYTTTTPSLLIGVFQGSSGGSVTRPGLGVNLFLGVGGEVKDQRGLVLGLYLGSSGGNAYRLIDGSGKPGLYVALYQGLGGASVVRSVYGVASGLGVSLYLGSVGGNVFNQSSQLGFRVFINKKDFTSSVYQSSVSGDLEVNFTTRSSFELRENINPPNALLSLANKYAQVATLVNPTQTTIQTVPGNTFDTQANFIAKLGQEYLWVSYIDPSGLATVTRGLYLSVAGSAIPGDKLVQVFKTSSFVEPLPSIPVPGEEVEIWVLNNEYCNIPHRDGQWYKMFGGTVIETETRYLSDLNTPTRGIVVSCVGYGEKLTHRYVKAVLKNSEYPNISDVLSYLETNFLQPEGILLVYPLVDIPLQGDTEFDSNLMDAVVKLCETVGYDYKVDFFRRLYIYDRPAQQLIAPYNVTDSTTGNDGEVWADLRIKNTLALYANRILVKGNYVMNTRQVTLTYTAGVSPEWPLDSFTDASGTHVRAPFLNDFTSLASTPIQRVVSITVNGTPQVFIELPNLNPPPHNWVVANVYPSTALSLIFDVLKPNVTWPKSGDVMVVVVEIPEGSAPPNLIQNSAQIAARAAIEGPSGVREIAQDFGTFSDGAAVLQAAQALLDKSSVPGIEANWNTIRLGAEPGQQITINAPYLGASNVLAKIEQMSWQIDQGVLVRQTYRASNTFLNRDYVAAWYRMLKRLKRDSKKVTDLTVWSLALTSPGFANAGIAVGTSITNGFIVHVKAAAVTGVRITFKTLAGKLNGPLVFQIRRNGIALTPSGITIPKDTLANTVYTAVVNWTGNINPVLVDGDLITLDCIAVPAGQAVTDITLSLSATY